MLVGSSTKLYFSMSAFWEISILRNSTILDSALKKVDPCHQAEQIPQN